MALSDKDVLGSWVFVVRPAATQQQATEYTEMQTNFTPATCEDLLAEGFNHWVTEALLENELSISDVRRMSVEDMFDRVLVWNGIVGYTSRILNAIDSIQRVVDCNRYLDSCKQEFAWHGFTKQPMTDEQLRQLHAAGISEDDAYCIGCDIDAGLTFEEALGVTNQLNASAQTTSAPSPIVLPLVPGTRVRLLPRAWEGRTGTLTEPTALIIRRGYDYLVVVDKYRGVPVAFRHDEVEALP